MSHERKPESSDRSNIPFQRDMHGKIKAKCDARGIKMLRAADEMGEMWLKAQKGDYANKLNR